MSSKPSHRPLGLISKTPDIVLFDWDDTLFNQAGIADTAYTHLLETYGNKPYPSSTELRQAWYANQQNCCNSYFNGTNPDTIKHAYDEFMKNIPPKEKNLLPGAREVLDGLKAKGIAMGVVSNKKESLLKEEIHHLELDDYFQVVIGAHAEKDKRKPNPYPVEEAMRVVNEQRTSQKLRKLRNERVWFVGDTLEDAHAAKADHIQRFHIGNEHIETVKNHAVGRDPVGQIIYMQDLEKFLDLANQLPQHTKQTLPARS